MGKQDFIKLFRMLQISCMYKINTKINFTYIYIYVYVRWLITFLRDLGDLHEGIQDLLEPGWSKLDLQPYTLLREFGFEFQGVCVIQICLPS